MSHYSYRVFEVCVPWAQDQTQTAILSKYAHFEAIRKSRFECAD